MSGTNKEDPLDNLEGLIRDCRGHHIRMTHLEREMERLRHELFGNGQPGELAKTEARTIAAMSEFTTKLSRVEEKVGKIMLFIAGLGALVGGGVTKLVSTLIGGA